MLFTLRSSRRKGFPEIPGTPKEPESSPRGASYPAHTANATRHRRPGRDDRLIAADYPRTPLFPQLEPFTTSTVTRLRTARFPKTHPTAGLGKRPLTWRRLWRPS
ncbi:hypothetical protein GCM10010428_06450 [Actinosynnema pretiosum subsp. pretiosum]